MNEHEEKQEEDEQKEEEDNNYGDLICHVTNDDVPGLTDALTAGLVERLRGDLGYQKEIWMAAVEDGSLSVEMFEILVEHVSAEITGSKASWVGILGEDLDPSVVEYLLGVARPDQIDGREFEDWAHAHLHVEEDEANELFALVQHS